MARMLPVDVDGTVGWRQGRRGTHVGKRMVYGMVAAALACLDVGLADRAFGDHRGVSLALLAIGLVGGLALQAGFSVGVSWSPDAATFRGVLVTRVIPWSAVAGFRVSPGAARLVARPLRSDRPPLVGPDLHGLVNGVPPGSPEHAVHAAEALNAVWKRRHLSEGAVPRPIRTTVSLPGALPLAWLLVHAAASVVLLGLT
ncbi:hypothetical protein Q6348_14255 [Isoptericola sp. b441]|uniref:PH domain-containing protein n=1 Tax=Actinotalea lenta TaxID=3064654 RepID=A0ABT9DF97_9CELL|nr:hypothetical protein [Isoptericola sp. b441]MDO8108357.1 hypothetical protein [Isoptericola sp. b441]